MKFFLKSDITNFEAFYAQNPTYFPIYIKTIQSLKETKIKLSKTEGGEIYALCDTEDFEIKDLFDYRLIEGGMKKIEVKNEQGQTTVKKIKQGNLFSFKKNN